MPDARTCRPRAWSDAPPRSTRAHRRRRADASCSRARATMPCAEVLLEHAVARPTGARFCARTAPRARAVIAPPTTPRGPRRSRDGLHAAGPQRSGMRGVAVATVATAACSQRSASTRSFAGRRTARRAAPAVVVGAVLLAVASNDAAARGEARQSLKRSSTLTLYVGQRKGRHSTRMRSRDSRRRVPRPSVARQPRRPPHPDATGGLARRAAPARPRERRARAPYSARAPDARDSRTDCAPQLSRQRRPSRATAPAARSSRAIGCSTSNCARRRAQPPHARGSSVDGAAQQPIDVFRSIDHGALGWRRCR